MNFFQKSVCLISFTSLIMAAGCVFQKGEIPAFLNNSDPALRPTKPADVSVTPAVTMTPFDVDTLLPTARLGETRQWAVKAEASSEYSDTKWSAARALGKPDALQCADDVNAWAAASQDTIEWIDLEYTQAVSPTEVTIFQNYNPSQVTEVAVFTADGSKHVIWEGYPERVEYCPDRMTVNVERKIPGPVKRVRVTLDQRVNGWGWNEIDAVELVGVKP